MPSGGRREGAGRKPGWSLRGENGGRSKKAENETAKHFSISCSPDDLEMIKSKALKSGKSVSRFIVELARAYEP